VNYLLYLNGILSYLRYLLCCSVGCCSCFTRHVRKYCRYLFWCSVPLGGSELSGGEAAYSRCSRGIFWMEKLSLLWLWFLLSMRSFRGFVLTSMQDAMVSKCVKFENGLKLEIYQYIRFHEIRDFDTLVHKCRMFDDAGKARMNYYKAVNDRKGKGHGFGKPYNKDKGKKKDVGGCSKVNVAEVCWNKMCLTINPKEF